MSVKHAFQLDYVETEWDCMPFSKRESVMLDQAKASALFAKEHVPFYAKHFSNISHVTIEKISSLEEFAVALPETTKHHISANPPEVFLPEVDYREVDTDIGQFRNWGTGGTTGTPATILHSPQDYHGISRLISSSMQYDLGEKCAELQGKTFLALYHGDHITNHAYRRAFTALGMNTFTRPSTKNDPYAVYELIQQVRPNALLGPPEAPDSAQTKGLTLDSIFKIDARNSSRGKWSLNHRENPEFMAVLWSSMSISPQFHTYIRDHLGIPYLQSTYGATEVGGVGATCSAHPMDFHLTYRTNLVSVKAFSGDRLARDGEDGYFLFSKVGALSSSSECIVPTGMFFLNYRPGDAGRLIQTNGHVCECGRNTPVLKNIHRHEHHKSKMLFGCQAD